ncbi:FadR/GntR family transcriptional regulator [Seohaeicola zhoushanensis]|nr:FCD domain-containing protein [Seohaeicola zhoushanensis]
MLEIKPVQTEKLFEVLAAQLRDEIMAGEFTSGDLLSEKYLMERSQLSRGSVRDALRVLEAQGLVETRRGRNGGSFVVESGVQTIVQSLDAYLRNGNPPLRAIMDTVELLEPGLARLAAQNRTPEDIDAMRDAIQSMADTDDRTEFVRRNSDWHIAMARAAHNPILMAVYQPIGSTLLHPHTNDFLDADMRAVVVAAARRILDAIADGDATLAFSRMQKHVDAYHAIRNELDAAASATDPTEG